MKSDKNNIKEVDSKILKYNPRFGEMLKAARPVDYKRCHKMLKGRLISSQVDQKSNAVIFDGTEDQLKDVIAGSKSKTKPGLFMTTQESVDIAKWSGEQNIRRLNSILIEFDRHHLLDEQIATIHESGLPYTLMVFSGNRSIHTLVVLDAEIKSGEMVDFKNRLAAIFPGADKTVLTSSNCFFRFPVFEGAYFQPLIKFNGLVKKNKFVSWVIQKHAEQANEQTDSGIPVGMNNGGVNITINGNVRF